ncbi:MAG TPA: hypothetical protein VIL74_21825 [Pyrinomonadaceae bacterium]|jgi:hypothetical protein
MKNSLLMLILTSGFLLFGVTDARACSCAVATTCEAFARAEYVFTGTVAKASETDGTRRHQVQIQENFLGMENVSLADVLTETASSCAFSMTEGKSYLIFAWKNEQTGELGTGMCSQTTEIESAQEAVAGLRRLKSSDNPGGIVQGKVIDSELSIWEKPKKPAQIDKVLIESKNGEKFEAAIAPDGKYFLDGLNAGLYKIYLDLPKGFITGAEADGLGSYDEDDENSGFVKVAGRGCTNRDFEIKINGVIGGRLIDADGLPVVEKRVNLLRLPDPNEVDTQTETALREPRDEEEDSNDEDPDSPTVDPPPAKEKFAAEYLAYSGENGAFIFKGLPPGRYLLGYGIDDFLNVNDDGDQYLPMFFPNSNKRETAIVIDLKKAEVLTDKNIQLAPKLKKRKISGRIVLKNGRRAANAEADFYLKREGYADADWGGDLKIDAKGNFTLDGYEETEYLIRAQVSKRVSDEMFEVTHSSKCFIVPKTGAVKPLKIVLEAGGANCDDETFRK